jgi:hypothetical protein
MLKSQQKEHLVGKAHIKRLKQIFSANASSNSSSQLVIVKNSSQEVSIITARTQKTKS